MKQLVFAAVLSVATLEATQRPTYFSRVDAVRVDVLVTERGHPVQGLTRDDFELRDNGVAQTIDDVESGEIPLNVVLSYDTSRSVTADRREHLRGASLALLAGLREEDQTALITFDDALALRCRLAKERACIAAALERLEGIGRTALIDGTYAALAVGESDPGRSLIVVFSDGLDTSSWMPISRVSEAAKRSNAVVYAVSVGRANRPEFLHDLTEATGGQLLEVESTSSLASVFLSILSEFRQRYVLSYTPRGVSTTGWHRLSVTLKRKGHNVKSRLGYSAGG